MSDIGDYMAYVIGRGLLEELGPEFFLDGARHAVSDGFANKYLERINENDEFREMLGFFHEGRLASQRIWNRVSR